MESDLIDRYVAELRNSLTWRTDVDDLADEVEGHLREASARLEATGVPTDEAQRRTLTCFGEVGLVARSFAATQSGALAVPTRLTRMAGTIALAAAGTWALSFLVALSGGWSSGFMEDQSYAGWAVCVAVATLFSGMSLIGLRARAGRPRGTGTILAGALAAVSLIMVSLAAWSWPFALLPLAAAGAIAVRGTSAARLRLSWAGLVLVWAWPVGLALVILGDEILRIGPVDTYGDHPRAFLLSFGFASMAYAAGLLRIGGRLRGEEPAELPAQAASADGATFAG